MAERKGSRRKQLPYDLKETRTQRGNTRSPSAENSLSIGPVVRRTKELLYYSGQLCPSNI